MIASADADTVDSIVQGGPNHGPDGRIHARRISTAGKYADTMNRRFHSNQILSPHQFYGTGFLNFQFNSLFL